MSFSRKTPFLSKIAQNCDKPCSHLVLKNMAFAIAITEIRWAEASKLNYYRNESPLSVKKFT
jgi:hypothetical protein